MRYRAMWSIAFGVALSGVCNSAFTQSFPTKTIRLVGVNNPGSTTDIRSRQVAEKLAPLLGQPVVVDPRPGVNGFIAAEHVASAPADGHTLLVSNMVYLTWAPHTMRLQKLSVNLDPVRSLAAVAMLSINPPILVAHPSAPFNTTGEMISWAKANPGKLNWAAVTPGYEPFFLIKLRRDTGAQIHFVPYKGFGGQMLTDLMANVVQVGFDFPAALLPFIHSGRLKTLAVLDGKRLPVLPNVPTLSESGYPEGLEMPNWMGIFAPVGTPKVVIQRIADATTKVLAMPDIRQKFEAAGATMGTLVTDKFQALVLADDERWGAIVRNSGIRPE